MTTISLRMGLVSVITLVSMASGAHAGGVERAGYNIDLLFDPSTYVGEAGVTYVMPQRDVKNVVDVNPANGVGANGIGGGLTSVRDTESYAVPRIGFKAAIGDAVDCMADYSQPWGAHSNPGANWAGANDNIETKIESDNYAATCSYKFDVGTGKLRIIGGGYYQEVSGFKERLVVGGLPAFFGASGIGRLNLAGDGWGWRAGLAYEIEEYAFRASLVYNSEVELDNLSGTLDLAQIPGAVNPANPLLGRVTPVFGGTSMPESVELKLQSGIAPNWLAFGSVKWTDWSQLQTIPFCPTSTKGIVACTAGGPTQATSLELLYQDGWTVSGGVGHKFNDQWSGAVSVTWDRGTSTTMGTTSDTWTLGSGVSYAPTKNVEFRLAGAVGVLTSGQSVSSDVSYTYDNDFVGALSTSLKVKF